MMNKVLFIIYYSKIANTGYHSCMFSVVYNIQKITNISIKKTIILISILNKYLDIPIYRIMQIVRGGKVSRLHNLLVIHGKTFTIVQQFETPCNRKAKNSLENLRDWRLIRKNRKSFPP